MFLKVYSIYDSGVEAYMQPFYARAKGEAIRMFTNTVNDVSTVVNAHPDQFTLFEIGVFDDKAGMVDCFAAPLSIGNGLEFKRSSNE